MSHWHRFCCCGRTAKFLGRSPLRSWWRKGSNNYCAPLPTESEQAHCLGASESADPYSPVRIDPVQVPSHPLSSTTTAIATAPSFLDAAAPKARVTEGASTTSRQSFLQMSVTPVERNTPASGPSPAGPVVGRGRAGTSKCVGMAREPLDTPSAQSRENDGYAQMLDSPRHFERPLLASIAGHAAGAIAGGAGAIAGGADRLRQGLAHAAAERAAERAPSAEGSGAVPAVGLLGAALRQGVGGAVEGAAGRLRHGIQTAAERRRQSEDHADQQEVVPSAKPESSGEPFMLSAARLGARPSGSDPPSIGAAVAEVALPAVSEGPAGAVDALRRNVVGGVVGGAQRLRQGIAHVAENRAAAQPDGAQGTEGEHRLAGVGMLLRQGLRPRLSQSDEATELQECGQGSDDASTDLQGSQGSDVEASGSDSAACSTGGGTPRSCTSVPYESQGAGTGRLEVRARLLAEVGTLRQGIVDARRGWLRQPSLNVDEGGLAAGRAPAADGVIDETFLDDVGRSQRRGQRSNPFVESSSGNIDAEQHGPSADVAAAMVGVVRDGVLGRAERLVHGLAQAAEARRSSVQPDGEDQQGDGLRSAALMGTPEGERRLLGVAQWLRRNGRDRLAGARGLDTDL